MSTNITPYPQYTTIALDILFHAPIALSDMTKTIGHSNSMIVCPLTFTHSILRFNSII
jgi:hypothetical protein